MSAYRRINNSARCVLKSLVEYIPLDSEPRHALLLLALLPILATGCNTSRQITAGGVSTPKSRDSMVADGVLEDTQSEQVSTAIRPVAHQVDDAIGNSGEDANQIKPARPVQLEPIPMPSSGSPDGMTLETIEELALANNPAIQQATFASAKASGIRNQVGLKPNPTVGYNGAQLADAGTDQHSLFVGQTFVRGDKLAWNREVVGHDVNVQNWLVETQRQRLRTDVRLAFYEALAAQKRLELAREFRDVAAKGVTVSRERLKADVGTRPDVLQSEIQLSEVDLSIQQAEFVYSAAWSELAALSGIPDLAQTKLIGELESGQSTRELKSEFAQIASASPLLAAAQARVDRARSNLQRQHTQPIPNVTTQLGAGYDNGTGQGFINLQLGVPVPIHNKNQGNIQSAHAELCEANQNVQRIRMAIRQDLARVMREYNVAEATVRQYQRTILPKAKEALELMVEAQDAGEFDFLRVLTARRAYFDSNLKYVSALGQLAQAASKLDGLLLTGGLSSVASYDGDDGLRGQALSGQ